MIPNDILVVEDNDLNRDCFVAMVKKVFPNSNVKAAATAADAIRVLSDDEEPLFELVVSDIDVPEPLSGLQVIETAHMLGAQVIAMSGACLEPKDQMALKAGANVFIWKAFTTDEFRAVANQVCEVPQAA